MICNNIVFGRCARDKKTLMRTPMSPATMTMGCNLKYLANVKKAKKEKVIDAHLRKEKSKLKTENVRLLHQNNELIDTGRMAFLMDSFESLGEESRCKANKLA